MQLKSSHLLIWCKERLKNLCNPALSRLVGLRHFLAYRQWLEALADGIPELQVISVAHGSPIVNNCNSRLREAAARLL